MGEKRAKETLQDDISVGAWVRSTAVQLILLGRSYLPAMGQSLRAVAQS